MKTAGWIVLLFIGMAFPAFSQKKLEIAFTRFGFLKKYEIPVGAKLEYKLKDGRGFRTGRIANLQDSLIIFDNENVVALGRIKLIRIRKNNYHNKLFQSIFLIGAVGYPFLNLVNNGLNDNRPLIDHQAMIVSASFLSASLIVRQLGIKRIRMTRHKTLKIISTDYEHLSKDRPEAH